MINLSEIFFATKPIFVLDGFITLHLVLFGHPGLWNFEVINASCCCNYEVLPEILKLFINFWALLLIISTALLSYRIFSSLLLCSFLVVFCNTLLQFYKCLMIYQQKQYTNWIYMCILQVFKFSHLEINFFILLKSP